MISHISDKIFNASNCGNNRASWLLKIGNEKDVTINLRHLMDFGDGSFKLNVVNKDKIIHSMDELLEIAGDLL